MLGFWFAKKKKHTFVPVVWDTFGHHGACVDFFLDNLKSSIGRTHSRRLWSGTTLLRVCAAALQRGNARLLRHSYRIVSERSAHLPSDRDASPPEGGGPPARVG